MCGGGWWVVFVEVKDQGCSNMHRRVSVWVMVGIVDTKDQQGLIKIGELIMKVRIQKRCVDF